MVNKVSGNNFTSPLEIREYYENLWNISQGEENQSLLEPKSRYFKSNMVKAVREYKNFSAIEEMIEEYLKKNPFEHETILSVGCGGGKDLEKMRKIFPPAKLFGIDVSSNALKESKKNSDAYLVCADPKNMPFRDDLKFDMLIAGEVFDIDAFADRELLQKTIEELTRYSAKKSRFYLAFYGFDEQDLELDSCTPVGEALTKCGWYSPRFDGIIYDKLDSAPFAHGVFWVQERQNVS
jgi:hypothetical protein